MKDKLKEKLFISYFSIKQLKLLKAFLFKLGLDFWPNLNFNEIVSNKKFKFQSKQN